MTLSRFQKAGSKITCSVFRAGFRSAAEVKEFGVSPPNDEPLLFRQKWPKPLPPRLASLEGRDANLRGADQLAEPVLSLLEGLKHGPQRIRASLPWASRQASGHRGDTTFRNFHERERKEGMREPIELEG
jgi:hypothetical protein